MEDSTQRHLLSRRNVLAGGAMGAGAIWAAPAVATVSTNVANAASGPPDRVRGPAPRGPGNNRGKSSGNNPGKGN